VAKRKPETCVWKLLFKGNFYWATGCLGGFNVESSNPIENGYIFCPACGKKVGVKK